LAVDKLSRSREIVYAQTWLRGTMPANIGYFHYMFLIYREWIALFAVLALFWREPLIGDRVFAACEEFCCRVARRKWLAIFLAFLIPILFRVSLLGIFSVRPPGVVDEFSYLLMGDTFAHGRLANPPHPMAAYLDTIFVLQHPTYASKYPPAQGVVLAVGQLFGHPWIGVLLSMGVLFAALVWMLQGWFPPKWALLGAALLFLRIGTFSYWMNSYWGGAATAIGGALVMGALPRMLRKRRPLDAFVMGFGVFILANSRPYEGFVMCLPVAAFLIWWLCSRTSPAWRVTLPRIVLPVAAIALLALGASGYYNWRVTGDPFLFPHSLYEKTYETVSSFIWNAPRSPQHYANLQFDTVFTAQSHNAYRHTWDDFVRITQKKMMDYFGFFVGPALLFPCITIPLIFTTRRFRFLFFQFVLFCLGLIAVIWSHPHYVAPIFGTFVILLTQMFRYLRRWTYVGRPVGIGLTRAIVLFSAAAVPMFAAQNAIYPRGLEGAGWGRSNWERAQIAKELSAMPGPQLVIVRYSQVHHDVGYEWVYNDADVDHSKVVWARGVPGQDLQPLFDYFKDRRVWLVEPDVTFPELERYTSLPANSGN
jgi:hypothetical protein